MENFEPILFNPLLSNKSMYTYCESNCASYGSTNVDTYTTFGNCVSSVPITNCAKIGNGHARITLISLS